MIDSISFLEQDFKLVPLQEEASTRRYFKVNVKSDFLNKYDLKLHKTFVLCKDIKINYDFIELSEFLLNNQINVPQVYAIDRDKSFILQEYLGIHDLFSEPDENYIAYLYKAIDILVNLQKLHPPSFVEERSFDFSKLNFEVQLTLTSLRNLQLSINLEFFIPNEFEFFLEATCKHLNNQEPKVFTHRDFHSRNIMINQDKLYIIDFQDARMGLPVYDLASILYDAYKPLSRINRKSMIQYFLLKTGIKTKGFYDTFYLQALQRSFKALGTYIIQINEKGNLKFLPSFYACLDNIEEISQLGQLPDSVYLFVMDLRKKIQNTPLFQWYE